MLAEGPVGYARLARAISEAQIAGEKGRAAYFTARSAAGRRRLRASWRAPQRTPGERRDEGQRSLVRAHRMPQGDGALRHLRARRSRPPRGGHSSVSLVAAFGRDRVLVELWDHGDPLDRHRNDALAQLAMATGVDVVATNNVHYATPAQRPLATALAAVRAGRSLDEIDGWLPAAPFAHLRSAGEQERRFARWPGAVARTVEIARACAFDLRLAAPELPDHDVPGDHTEMTWLRELTRTRRGAARTRRVASASTRRAMHVRSNTSSASSSSSASPAISCCCTTSSSSAVAPTSTARGGGARRTARSVTRSGSPRPTRSISGCCSSASSHSNATVRPTSTSTSSTSGARR